MPLEKLGAYIALASMAARLNIALRGQNGVSPNCCRSLRVLWSSAGLPIWDAAIETEDPASPTPRSEGVRRSAPRSQFSLSPARCNRGRNHYCCALFGFRSAWHRKGRKSESCCDRQPAVNHLSFRCSPAETSVARVQSARDFTAGNGCSSHDHQGPRCSDRPAETYEPDECRCCHIRIRAGRRK